MTLCTHTGTIAGVSNRDIGLPQCTKDVVSFAGADAAIQLWNIDLDGL